MGILQHSLRGTGKFIRYHYVRIYAHHKAFRAVIGLLYVSREREAWLGDVCKALFGKLTRTELLANILSLVNLIKRIYFYNCAFTICFLTCKTDILTLEDNKFYPLAVSLSFPCQPYTLITSTPLEFLHLKIRLIYL